MPGRPLRRGPRRFNIGRVMRALAILCVVPGFSLGLIAGVTHLVGPLEPGSAQQTNLVWSNRVFTTRRDFGSWLVSRGSNYELWSQRHPVALHHFDDVSRRSLAASASAQDSRRQAQSGAALPIAVISCAVLLAMLALPRFVRSARFLLQPRSTGLRLRGPPSTIVAAVTSRSGAGARAPRRPQAPARPRSALLPEAVRFDWRKGWTTLGRLGRVAPGRAALPAKSNSRLVRHYLPKVTFYTAVVVLSFAIGAWVAIYLQ
jgi:hypothetical protein